MPLNNIKYKAKNTLKVDVLLADFIDQEVLPDLKIDAATFWQSFADLIHGLAPVNRKLLKKRSELQFDIDQWLLNNRDQFDQTA